MPEFNVKAPDGTVLKVTAPEGATEAQAIAYAQQQYAARQESAARRETAPALGLEAGIPTGTGVENFLMGMGATPGTFMRGIQQLVAPSPALQEKIDVQKQFMAPLMETGSGMAGNIAAHAAATLPLAFVPAGATLPAALAIGAGLGAGTGLISPVASDESRMANVLTGALGGAGGAGVARGVGAMAPRVTESVRGLLREGVPLTPGQMVGGSGPVGAFLRGVEEKSTSIPGLGAMIEGAQRRAVVGFNRAALNRVTRHLGTKAQRVGYEGVDEVDALVSKAYDTVLDTPGVGIKPDAGLSSELETIMQLADELPADSVRQLKAILRNRVAPRATDFGNMSARSFKMMDSDLGEIAKGLGRGDSAQQQLSMAVRQIQKAFRDNLERSSPVDAVAGLKKANRAFAELIRVEDAAARIGAKQGVFSPAQFESAVRKMDPSRRKKAFGHGEALMQDLATWATDVLPPKVPDSGTAGRALNTAFLAGLFDPTFLLGAAAGAVPYSRPGAAAARGLIRGAAAAGAGVRRGTIPAGVAGAAGLLATSRTREDEQAYP